MPTHDIQGQLIAATAGLADSALMTLDGGTLELLRGRVAVITSLLTDLGRAQDSVVVPFD